MCYKCVKNSINLIPCKIRCLQTLIWNLLFGFTCQPVCDTVLGHSRKAHTYLRSCRVVLAMLCKVWLQCSSSLPRRPSSACCKERICTCLNTCAEGRFHELAKAVDQIQFYSDRWCLVQNNILGIQLKRGKLLFFLHWTSYLLQLACYLYF